jgi:hypothetical protein
VVRRLFLVLGVLMGGAASRISASAAPRAPAAAPETFHLSAIMEAWVETHERLVAEAKRSPQDFCRLVSDTVEIVGPLVKELEAFEGNEHRSPPLSEEDARRAFAETASRVVGIQLVTTAELQYGGVDYRALARLAPPDALPLLRALGAFELGSEGIESWLVRVTEYSACHAPERARPALAALASSWRAAPACLKEAVRDRLDRNLADMAKDDCFCSERAPALAAARKNLPLMKKLVGTRGPELAKQLLETAQSPRTRFACSPS